MNNNPWIENTGTVPEGVGPDTVIEVEYRDGYIMVWDNFCNENCLWGILNDGGDIIRWRFV